MIWPVKKLQSPWIFAVTLKPTILTTSPFFKKIAAFIDPATEPEAELVACPLDIILLFFSIERCKSLLYLFKNDVVKKYAPSYGAVKCPVWGLYALPILVITWSNTTVCPCFNTTSFDSLAWNAIAYFFIWSATPAREYQWNIII